MPPRFLRAAVGTTALLLVFSVAKLLRPALQDRDLPGPEELTAAKHILADSAETLPNLALLGDKALLFADQQRGFVMYGVEKRSWIAMGDPVGPADVAQDLGMAPLSGFGNRPFAPLWNRIGAIIFNQGEHFYNFEGLREYKQKFNPRWEPRYLAGPGGLSLPLILLNIAALISGGVKGVISK